MIFPIFAEFPRTEARVLREQARDLGQAPGETRDMGGVNRCRYYGWIGDVSIQQLSKVQIPGIHLIVRFTTPVARRVDLDPT